MYQTFLSRVADGRKKSIDEIHEVAQGRVWTGQKAVSKGLVDELGGLQDAIQLAADLAEVGDNYKEVTYPKIKKEIWEEILGEINLQSASILPDAWTEPKLTPAETKVYKAFEEFRSVMSYREPMAKLPFVISEH